MGLKTIEIDEVADISALYEELCKITKTNNKEMRRFVLGFIGTESVVLNKAITFNDIIKIITKKGMYFSLKVQYEETTNIIPTNNESIIEPPKESSVYLEMEAQKQDIKVELEPIERFVVKKNRAIGFSHLPEIDASKIPDFK